MPDPLKLTRLAQKGQNVCPISALIPWQVSLSSDTRWETQDGATITNLVFHNIPIFC